MPEPEIIEDTKGEYVKYTDEKKEIAKGRAGYKVKSYRVYYDESGKEVERKGLYTDTYLARKGKVYVGVTPRESQMPEPTPTPSAGPTPNTTPSTSESPSPSPSGTAE